MYDLSMSDELENIAVESDDDVKVELVDFQQAVIWGTDWTTETILSQMNKGNIDLNPKFQRREAWTGTRKSKFIESLILGLPIPQIILAERKNRKGTYIVIDGKQRLISLRQFFSDEQDTVFPPLKLSKLNSLNTLNGMSFRDLKMSHDLNDYTLALENQPIRTIVIKNWPNEEFLYNVFLRLNTGSLPLAPQELRQALHPGKFIDFTDDYSVQSSAIKKILNITKPDYRMRDVELVIRYYSFKYFINDYKGNLKKFFDDTVQILNNKWEEEHQRVQSYGLELEEAINFTYQIWGENAFRKWSMEKYEGRFNRAIYDIMVHYFSNPEIREHLAPNKTRVKNAFERLCATNVEFLSAFETSTKNITPTSKRFGLWGEVLQEITGININLPTIG